ncbi:MAG: PAS domain-containing sensor histidine kinase [Vampirovibrio sp.]|nr:PAS domain-containing sensor histidine kinase [Vampirovibrio sp.]
MDSPVSNLHNLWAESPEHLKNAGFCQLANFIQDYGVFLLDPDGEILSWNLGGEKILGYTENEVLGQHFSFLFTPDEVSENQPQQEIATAKNHHLTLSAGWFLRKDGSRVWIHDSLHAVYNADETVVGYVKIFRDDSEKKESEEVLNKYIRELSQIKSALDESTIVAMTDAKGKINYVNDAFCRISQYSRQELIGQDHRIINAGYHPKAYIQDLWQTIQAGDIWRGDMKNKAKDGSFYWVDTTILPFLGDNGTPEQYIAIRHEITDKKQIETDLRLLNESLEARIDERTQDLQQANEELKQALHKLQESEQLRDTFISALTHDMRTPLVAEKRALELLQKHQNLLPEKIESLIPRLIGSNDALLEMVNRLLDIYQFEAGRIRLLPETVNLAELTQQCIDHVQVLADEKQIHLVNKIPLDLPTITGDPQQLKRVLTNLLGNALANIPAGCTVTLNGQTITNYIQITVADNGPGIDPEMLPHLFERYFTAQKTRKKIGSGLGLYICKMILDLHGGKIEAHSTLGQGAIFTITFPLKLPTAL